MAPNTTKGDRSSRRRVMFTPFCTWLMSLVMRVMREAEEKRSMSAKENSCTLSKRHWRRLAPKPMAALAASTAAPTPQPSAAMAIRNIFRPVSRM